MAALRVGSGSGPVGRTGIGVGEAQNGFDHPFMHGVFKGADGLVHGAGPMFMAAMVLPLRSLMGTEREASSSSSSRETKAWPTGMITAYFHMGAAMCRTCVTLCRVFLLLSAALPRRLH